MALVTRQVTGTFYYPNGDPMSDAYVTFELTNDTQEDGSAALPDTFSATQLDSSGNLDIDLWPNERGTEVSFYKVEVTFTDPTSGKRKTKRLNKIQVPASAGPHDIGTLLGVGSTADAPGYYTVLSDAEYTELVNTITAISTGNVVAGSWDASSGSFPSGSIAGTFYIVSASGTVDGVSFFVEDRLYPIVDSASTTTYSGNWVRDPRSEVVPVVYDNVATLVASLESSRGVGVVWEVAGGFQYTEVASGGDLVTAGGVHLDVVHNGEIHAAAVYQGEWGAAITLASSILSAAGGGTVRMGGGFFTLSTPAILSSGTTLIGAGSVALGGTNLIAADGSEISVVESINFDDLTGTLDTVASNPDCPYFVGISGIRVDGNKANNSAGAAGVRLYSSGMTVKDLYVDSASGDGIATEYGNLLGSSVWTGQEEGSFNNVICMRNGGEGWSYKGPHNSHIGRAIAAYNGSWGFHSYGHPADSSIDGIDNIHSYANGDDKGIWIEGIARVSTMITDGDNAVIDGANTLVGQYRSANAAQSRSGLIVNGNNVTIGQINMSVHVDAVGQIGIEWNGDHGKLSGVTMTTNQPDAVGMQISGSEGIFSGLDIKGFSGFGRFGLRNLGSNNRINGQLSLNTRNFFQAAGQSNNNIKLTVLTSSGQLAVDGAAPGSTDIFEIRASGAGQAGRTFFKVQTATFAADTTTAGTITVAHGCLYTPEKADIALTLLQSSPDDAALELAYLRVNSVDATNVTIGYKFSTAGTAGTLARIGVTGRV